MADKKFIEKSEHYKLIPQETELLYAAATESKIDPPESVFDSIASFELAFNTQIESIKKKYPDKPLEHPEGLILSAIRKKVGHDTVASLAPLLSSRMIDLSAEGAVYENEERILISKAAVVFKSEFIFRVSNYASRFQKDKEVCTGRVLLFSLPRKDGMYSFKVKVFSVSDNFIDFCHSVDFTKKQIRKFVRVDTDVTVTVLLNDEMSPEIKAKKTRTFRGNMVNIGGGGICFVSGELVNAGSHILVDFSLDGADYKKISAQVVRSYTIEDAPPHLSRKHHVQFTIIESRMREKIIRYVFDQQRVLLKTGI